MKTSFLLFLWPVIFNGLFAASGFHWSFLKARFTCKWSPFMDRVKMLDGSRFHIRACARCVFVMKVTCFSLDRSRFSVVPPVGIHMSFPQCHLFPFVANFLTLSFCSALQTPVFYACERGSASWTPADVLGTGRRAQRTPGTGRVRWL